MFFNPFKGPDMKLLNQETLLAELASEVELRISDMNRFIRQDDMERALESQNIATGLRNAVRIITFGDHQIKDK